MREIGKIVCSILVGYACGMEFGYDFWLGLALISIFLWLQLRFMGVEDKVAPSQT